MKQMRKGFVPRFVRLTDESRQILSSDKRPEALADHFEHKQWGNVKTAARKEEIRNDPTFRNNLL